MVSHLGGEDVGEHAVDGNGVFGNDQRIARAVSVERPGLRRFLHTRPAPEQHVGHDEHRLAAQVLVLEELDLRVGAGRGRAVIVQNIVPIDGTEMVLEPEARDAKAGVGGAHVMGLHDGQVDEVVGRDQALGEGERRDIHRGWERRRLGGAECLRVAVVTNELHVGVDAASDERCLRHHSIVQAVGDVVYADVGPWNAEIQQGLNDRVDGLDERVDVRVRIGARIVVEVNLDGKLLPGHVIRQKNGPRGRRRRGPRELGNRFVEDLLDDGGVHVTAIPIRRRRSEVPIRRCRVVNVDDSTYQ